MNDKITRHDELGIRPTRHTDEYTVTVPATELKQADRAFTTQGPQIWNSLPTEVKEAPSVNSFKRRYKKVVLCLQVWEP